MDTRDNDLLDYCINVFYVKICVEKNPPQIKSLHFESELHSNSEGSQCALPPIN